MLTLSEAQPRQRAQRHIHDQHFTGRQASGAAEKIEAIE
jgi:hypothetical protein